jgi:carboxypeptidase Taq
MNLYETYVRKMQRIADLQHATAVLHWDKEVNLPSGASHFRSQQIATLSSMAHQLFTEDSTGKLLDQLSTSSSLDEDQKRNVELSLRDYRKEVLLPSDFVERLAMAQSESFSAWIEARKVNDFGVFAGALQKVVELKREEADLRRKGGERYDALLDNFEPGLTSATLDALFEDARTKIIPLIRTITSRESPDSSFLRRKYPRDDQWAFGLKVIEQLGYRFEHGRQDISEHPFTISFSPQDVRVTTRIDEHDFSNMLWSCIHECGHGMYEQGLPTVQYGLPLGSPASLAIHESQSRLWENQVGRSLAFWKFQFPRLKSAFPEQLSVDLFEINEAFSVQVLAVLRDLGIEAAHVNVNGGAVALGHPIGASGARVLTTLLHALAQRQLRRGIASLCLGGGNGVALAVERL